jgi:hypothetical protein
MKKQASQIKVPIETTSKNSRIAFCSRKQAFVLPFILIPKQKYHGITKAEDST